jgi:hypothetical protein
MPPIVIFLIIVATCILIYYLCNKCNKQKIHERFANMEPLNNGLNPEFYPKDKICDSPPDTKCVTNDSCAQYSIGEQCRGPLGNMKCSCQSKSGDNNSLSVNNAVIKAGAVCDTNKQCETGYCGTVPGIFSKMCKCPENSTLVEGKCVELSKSVIADKNMKYAVGYNISGVPDAKTQACSSTGKACSSNSDCSLGEGCNPNGMCVCMLNYTNDVEANKIKVGGNCQNTEQCSSTGQCVNNVCECPSGTFYNFSNNECECADPELVYSKAVGCVKPNKLPKQVCNSPSSFICDSNNSCGIGEYCDPVSRRCLCNANTYSSIIKIGGKCDSNDQCESGICDNMNGTLDYKICKNVPPISLYQLAKNKYSY